MKKIDVGNSGVMASEVVLGCMRMAQIDASAAARVIQTSFDGGINFFDHADVYGKGNSEKVFAKALKQTGIKREDIILQSKCGIQNGYYDFSKQHILESVDGILRRLETDYLDVLLLHRPDALVEPQEVADAFNALQISGKVRNFGVSNHHMMQIELLRQSVSQKFITNQLQFSPVHTGMVDIGLCVNMKVDNSIVRDGMLLDYCRLNDITIQAWSPFQHGLLEGVFLENPDFAPVTKVIQKMANDKGITDSAMTVSWILRHPAKMQVIIGSMNPARIEGICKADAAYLTREEWYEIYKANGNLIP